MAKFELRPDRDDAIHAGLFADEVDQSFSDTVLLRNAAWFIKLRWLVAGIFALLLLASHLGVMAFLEVNVSRWFLGGMSLGLVIVNILFVAHRRHSLSVGARWIRANLWLQIFYDLTAVTVVVHEVGSTDTFAPFIFVLHIALACIFFPHRESFLVALVSALFYVGCVLLEMRGLIAHNHIFGKAILREPGHESLQITMTVVLFFSIWFVISYLAAAVRQRELELLDAQEMVLKIFREGQQHYYHTAHEMKAPLVAIRSNLALLKDGYVGELDPEARKIVTIIDARCEAMGNVVVDVLTLADIKAAEGLDPQRELVDLSHLLSRTVEDLSACAGGRGIDVQSEICKQVTVMGREKALKMLLDNLVANAINYSHDNGTVRVACRAGGEASGPVLTVTDEGIGIAEDKLPSIFCEYFRTKEAKRYNPRSTGVGLAIVKQVATSHDIDIAVESASGKGTKFTLTFPQQDSKD